MSSQRPCDLHMQHRRSGGSGTIHRAPAGVTSTLPRPALPVAGQSLTSSRRCAARCRNQVFPAKRGSCRRLLASIAAGQLRVWRSHGELERLSGSSGWSRSWRKSLSVIRCCCCWHQSSAPSGCSWLGSHHSLRKRRELWIVAGRLRARKTFTAAIFTEELDSQLNGAADDAT